MLVKVVQRLTPEEVRSRIAKFEGRFKIGFEEFERRFLEGGMDSRSWKTYVEWAELTYAWHGYLEGGELDYTVETYIDIDENSLRFILAPKRIRILQEVARGVSSIYGLKNKVGRDIKNVYVEVKKLEKMKLLRLKKEGGKYIPELIIEEITLRFK